MRIIDIVYWVVGLIAAIFAVYKFYRFVTSPGIDTNSDLWMAIGAAVVACVCAVAYFLRHVNKEEEIHITQ
ncbi:MAG: hypothetical protein M3371_02280 [Acidobacteriota bacterium]|nr:hypothetical protein [Acidobacteriota bacterium]